MSDKILPITMPKWGLTMKEGTIVSWLKEVGDEIKKGDNLVEIETEKVVNEFESPESGILLKKIAEVNIKLNVGSLIGILGEKIVDDNSINQYSKYVYRIRAYAGNLGYYSDYSNTVSFTKFLKAKVT